MNFSVARKKYASLAPKTKTALHLVLAFFIALTAMFSQDAPPKPKTTTKPTSLDTFIPKGFVLVPIEVENVESLDQLLGQYGTVDLYPSYANNPQSSRTPVARSIRLLRSPMSANHFAVLAPETQAPWLVQHPGPFRVVIRNQHQLSGTKIDIPKANIKRRQIVVEVIE